MIKIFLHLWAIIFLGDNVMIVVSNSKQLRGCVEVCGSKNAALPIMAACLAVCGTVTLDNIPKLLDTHNMASILERMGCSVDTNGHTVHICSDNITTTDAPAKLTGLLRASFIVSGALLARFGRVRVALPGGCRIGTRPVDLHLKGLSCMGARTDNGNGYIELSCSKLNGADIYLDFPSVGATENILIAACLAKGRTVITNAATEPEVADLAYFLTKCGARIDGIGTEQLTINGVDKLSACRYSIIPDRIEAGTYMIASAITGGDVTVKGADAATLSPVISKLREMGVEVCDNNSIRVVGNILNSVNIKTMPHPGFPTDMQAQFSSLMCVSNGTSVITETIFENRFMHISELLRMHADITIDGRNAVISGKNSLIGCRVASRDLRGGAALVLAGLAAQGITTVENAHYIDRGYENFVPNLQQLGADIEYR